MPQFKVTAQAKESHHGTSEGASPSQKLAECEIHEDQLLMPEWPLCEYEEQVGATRTAICWELEMALRLEEAYAGTVLGYYWAICARRAANTLKIHGERLPAPCARAIMEEKQQRYHPEHRREETQCPNLS